MNEASSKYVDQIAVEKLLTEKLSKVHHFPNENGSFNNINLSDLRNIDGNSVNIKEEFNNNIHEIIFSSLIDSGYNENDTVKCIFFESKSEFRKGSIIFIHGLYEDNTQIYNFFISMLF